MNWCALRLNVMENANRVDPVAGKREKRFVRWFVDINDIAKENPFKWVPSLESNVHGESSSMTFRSFQTH